MFSIRRMVYKRVALSESDALPQADIQDLEKSKDTLNFVPSTWQKVNVRQGRRPSRKFLVLILTLLLIYVLGPTLVNEIRAWYQAGTDGPVIWALPPDNATPVGFENLKPICSSRGDQECKKLMDGSTKTAWTSDEAQPADGHSVTVDLLKSYNVTTISVEPDIGESRKEGFPYKHAVDVSKNGKDWIRVATGTWRSDSIGVRYATFEPSLVQHVRLSILEMTAGKKFVTINELKVLHIPPEFSLPSPAKGGRWSLTINFPIVPATAFFNPVNGELVTSSAFAPDNFSMKPKASEAYTRSATWSPRTGMVREKIIDETKHDMFCPGTSFDKDGRVLVTGGTNPLQFSIFDPSVTDQPAGQWQSPASRFQLGRGYAGQTYVADGTTFMIGGIWGSAETKNEIPRNNDSKDGEVYDGQKWHLLSDVKGDSIRMDEVIACQGKGEDKSLSKCKTTEWQQHHAWLFAWKNNTIFHAGPSKEMHWFHTTLPNGKTVGAGRRDVDNDAVCGITSMYDAEAGLILTAGGAVNYHYYVREDLDDTTKFSGPKRKEASKDAFEIKLGKTDENVVVKKMPSMQYQRIFANGVILPTGQTLVVGGQKQGEPFWEETWQPIPEIYTPGLTSPWREVARHSTPRVYHSWALLTTNATVIVGGGGLHPRRQKVNRFDAQVYEPPYLFEADGVTLAKQPVITKPPSKVLKLLDTPAMRTIKVTTDVAIDAASLLRYGAVTHSLNNDMRRIKLIPKPVNGETNTYTMEIPDEPGVALPGYWMLFVLAKGVPSKAETVQVIVKA